MTHLCLPIEESTVRPFIGHCSYDLEGIECKTMSFGYLCQLLIACVFVVCEDAIVRPCCWRLYSYDHPLEVGISPDRLASDIQVLFYLRRLV